MIESILTIAVVFTVASGVLLIFNRLNHPSISAYILAGIIISPFVAKAGILSLAEIGIAFLVFIFGSSLRLKEMEEVMEGTILLTVAQVLLIGSLVYLYAYVFGFGVLNSLYLAVVASLSSSLVGMELINGTKVKLAYKRLCVSMNLTQDLMAIMIFLVLASYPLTRLRVVSNIQLGGLILLAGVVLSFLIPKVLEFVRDSFEAYMLIAISTLLVFTSLSGYLGISVVIGSFAAGLALSKPPYDQGVIQILEPLKDFFSALFFVSLGALVVMPSLSTLLISIALILVVSVIKPVFTTLLLESKGYSKGISLMTALNLDQMSEFALILAIYAYFAGQMMSSVFQAIILSTVVTMIISSYTSRHVWDIYDKIKDYRLFNLHEGDLVKSKLPENLQNHFIIAGYDIQGKEIAYFLISKGQEVVVIDNDPKRITTAKLDGINYVYGDLMIQDIWEKVNYKRAKMIISTVPLENITKRVVGLETTAHKIVRCKKINEAKKYLNKVLYIIVPRYLSCSRLIENIEGSLNSERYREGLRKISRNELTRSNE